MTMTGMHKGDNMVLGLFAGVIEMSFMLDKVDTNAYDAYPMAQTSGGTDHLEST